MLVSMLAECPPPVDDLIMIYKWTDRHTDREKDGQTDIHLLFYSFSLPSSYDCLT